MSSSDDTCFSEWSSFSSVDENKLSWKGTSQVGHSEASKVWKSETRLVALSDSKGMCPRVSSRGDLFRGEVSRAGKFIKDDLSDNGDSMRETESSICESPVKRKGKVVSAS